MGSSFEDLTEATSGAIGGLLSTSILYPLDTCKTKYQAEARNENSRKYRSTFDVLKEAYSTGQCLSLYQGVGTKNFQSFLSQFIYFYSYSFIRNVYLQKRNKKRMDTGANLIVAAAAGACTSLIIQPLDTASARMQTSTFGKSKSLWQTLRDADWRHAFDGLGASLILTSNPAIQYTVFEQVKGRILRIQAQKASVRRDTSPVVLSALSAFLLGAFSKTIATIITYPAIRCKVLLQAAESEVEERNLKSKSMVDAIRIIWHREGASGFYKGLQAQILKTILSASIMLMIKEKTSRSTWFLMMRLRQWLSRNQPRIKIT